MGIILDLFDILWGKAKLAKLRYNFSNNRQSSILAKKIPNFANFVLGLNFAHYQKCYISTLPTLPSLKRSQISPKVSLTLPTLPWVWTLLIIRKVISELCQLCLVKKKTILAKKITNFANFALGLNFAHYQRCYISTLPTLPSLKRSQISPKVSLTLPTLPWVWTLLIIRKVISELCQLCLVKKRQY